MPTILPFQKDSLVLRPSAASVVKVLLIEMGFIGTGVWMLRNGEPNTGWLGIGFGGAGGLITLASILANRTYLWVTVDGLTQSGLFGVRHLDWSTVEWCQPARRWVTVRYLKRQRVRTLTIDSRYFGMQPKELAVLLNQWRVRAAREK